MPLRENLIDARFVGREITIYVMGVKEPIKGVIDEVARYEIGLRVQGVPVVVFRHAMLYAVAEAVELHGYSGEQLRDTVIDSEMIGADAEIHLINGESVNGKLMKVTKYELGFRSGDKGLIIPKSSIALITFKQEGSISH